MSSTHHPEPGLLRAAESPSRLAEPEGGGGWVGERVAACLNIELKWKESIAPFLSRVICEDLFPSIRFLSHGKKRCPYYVGMASPGKHL